MASPAGRAAGARERAGVVHVRVPATSGNMGPGFDVLGLALDLHNEFTAAPAAETRIEVDGAGGDLPRDATNLFYRAFAHLYAAVGRAAPPLHVRMRLPIPAGRGLGSSATAVVGGLLAANARLGAPFDAAGLLPHAVALEHGRHPDNVAPALFGGLVVNVLVDDAPLAVPVPVPAALRAVVYIPDFPMDTVAGRALMPACYPRADVVFNTSRVALFLAALAQERYDWLRPAMEDRLHQPYRAQLFPAMPALIAAALARGCPRRLPGGRRLVDPGAGDRPHGGHRRRAGGRGRGGGPDGARPRARHRARGRAGHARGGRMSAGFACGECGRTYPVSTTRYRCDCGAPLDLTTDATAPLMPALFDARLGSRALADRSGVWRFRELLPPLAPADLVSKPEGNTNLYAVGAEVGGGLARVGAFAGLAALYAKHEGENPTGSFKDRGMTVGVSQARALGAAAVACASTGNTSSSLASYAAQAGLPCFVFVPEGKITASKLAQTLAYGAVTLQIRGDFDAAMRLVEAACVDLGIYLLNSLNPFRIEGQKTIVFDLLQQLAWDPPDWIVLPAGNLGNTAAFGKALQEARTRGLIARLPRLAAVQAAGAAPFYQSFASGFAAPVRVQAETVASAIKIGAPVSYARARAAIRATGGVVTAVPDSAILEAKAVIDRAGIGCEPASAAALAGARRLVADGVIAPDARVALILTGHLLKDAETTAAYHLGTGSPRPPGANAPVVVDPTLDAVRAALAPHLARG